MFAEPQPVTWLLGALLVLRLVELRRARGAAAEDPSPALPLFHGAWLAGLVLLATGRGEFSVVWGIGATALIGWRAVALLRGARRVPRLATLAELVVLPLACGLWAYALAGAAVYAALTRRQAPRGSDDAREQ